MTRWKCAFGTERGIRAWLPEHARHPRSLTAGDHRSRLVAQELLAEIAAGRVDEAFAALDAHRVPLSDGDSYEPLDRVVEALASQIVAEWTSLSDAADPQSEHEQRWCALRCETELRAYAAMGLPLTAESARDLNPWTEQELLFACGGPLARAAVQAHKTASPQQIWALLCESDLGRSWRDGSGAAQLAMILAAAIIHPGDQPSIADRHARALNGWLGLSQDGSWGAANSERVLKVQLVGMMSAACRIGASWESVSGERARSVIGRVSATDSAFRLRALGESEATRRVCELALSDHERALWSEDRALNADELVDVLACYEPGALEQTRCRVQLAAIGLPPVLR